MARSFHAAVRNAFKRLWRCKPRAPVNTASYAGEDARGHPAADALAVYRSPTR